MTTQTIRVLPNPSASSGQWTPVCGPIFTELLKRRDKLSDEEREGLRLKSLSILGRCLPPQPKSGEPFAATTTGLAVGYVQSGKTLSFTCVSAAAADNGFPLIIIVTGTTAPLYRQTADRLRADLVDSPEAIPWRWQLFDNPDPRKQNDLRTITDTIAKWHDERQHPEDRQTALLIVMKNHRRLHNLAELLGRVDLSKTPVLIIDDEADQASLNNLVNQQDQSRTYQRILELKARLSRHTYLQYTATPQAPLLINIIDALSPKFASVLEPGSAYTDLESFFYEGSPYVEIIPDHEIPSDTNVLSGSPPSLERALQLFFIGVAHEIARSSKAVRSMLVHPSQLTLRHADFLDWTNAVLSRWRATLDEPDGHPDREELLQEFKSAYDDLATTQQDIESFTTIGSCLGRALRAWIPWEVNARSGRTEKPDWTRARAHILVGGTAVDRGFTVEGLTVTYMPRGPGVGNADTIQQRARFLGYKAAYLGLCRVFVEQNVCDAYTAYVKHETDIRKRLADFDQKGKPLYEWKRAFFLEQTLRPTRQSVLSLAYQQGTYSDAWFFPKGPHILSDAVAANLKTVNEFITGLRFRPDHGHPSRTEQTRHGIAEGVPLQNAYENLLVRFKVPHPRDSQEMTGILLQIRAYLDDNPDATASVYLMSWEADKPQHKRERSVSSDDDSEITTARAFFQGPNRADSSRGIAVGSVYPGDEAIRRNENLTIQIHRLRVVDKENKNVIADDVYALALWVPAAMERDTLVQEPRR